MNATDGLYHSNGNGHPNGNGNGHAAKDDKVFYLQRATDPDTLAVLEARNTATEDLSLSKSARLFFCKLIDLALHPKFFECKGVVTISDKRLGKMLGWSERTIYNLKREVAQRGYFWLSRKFVPNMWALTTYHLTCLHRPRTEQRTDEHGTYGGDGLRSLPKPALGARRPGQPGLPLPGSKQAPPEPKNEDSPIIAGETREKLPARAAENCGSEPQKIAGESRKELRARAAKNCGREPQKIAGESRSDLRAAAATDCRLIEPQKGAERPIEAVPPPDLAFERWVKSLERKFQPELERLEKKLTADLRAARSSGAKEQIKRKLSAVHDTLYGPSVIDEPAAAKPATVIPLPAAPDDSEADDLIGAEFLVKAGKPNLLTERQKAALAKARGTTPTKGK